MQRLEDRDGEHDERSRAYSIDKRVNYARLNQEIDEAFGHDVLTIVEGDPRSDDLIIWVLEDLAEDTLAQVIEDHDPDAEEPASAVDVVVDPESPQAVARREQNDLLADLAEKDDLTDDEVRLAVQTLLIPYRRKT